VPFYGVYSDLSDRISYNTVKKDMK